MGSSGALGLPDIGQLFPDNDPKWSGADSSVFMEEAYRRMEDRGFRVGNVDVTLILQKPKVYGCGVLFLYHLNLQYCCQDLWTLATDFVFKK